MDRQDQPTAQFYHVVTTNHFPYRVCGAQQDNSGVCGPSRSPGGIPISEWYDVSGETGFVQARPDNPEIIYGGYNSGLIGGSIIARDSGSSTRGPRVPTVTHERGEVPFPVDVSDCLSPHDPNRSTWAAIVFRHTTTGRTSRRSVPT